MTFHRFVVIAGLSGAGKTQTMKTFEDLGFQCADNLPPAMLERYVELAEKNGAATVAVALDVRTGGAFGEPAATLERLRRQGGEFELLFLEADDATLIRRYSETRRRHPFELRAGSLRGAIESERALLAPVRALASRVIDTSDTTPWRLKATLSEEPTGYGRLPGMRVAVTAFGFKYGLPPDADLVFDVRFLPNPNYVPELRPLTGADAPVAAYLDALPEIGPFLAVLFDFMDFVVPRYVREGKPRLTVAVGCTGGRHRSVYVATRLAAHLRERSGLDVSLHHRELAVAS